MVCEIIETERLVLKPFASLSEEQKKELIKSWDNPFNARFNAEPDSAGSVEELFRREEPTFKDILSYRDTMYFRVVYDKVTGELIGSCRFGKYPEAEDLNTWDFGFNVLLRHWSKGYGSEMVKKFIEIARENNAKYFRGGASNDNLGSYHAMIKNGLKYIGIDNDGDFEYQLDLSAEKPTEEEIKQEWKNLIKMYKTRPDEENATFGAKKLRRLKKINRIIKKMVKKIQAGEDEDSLVKKCFERCNAIETFPMD